MKRFHFALEQVLRWRSTVAELRKTEALACAKTVTEAELDLQRLRQEQAEAARQLAAQGESAAMAAYAVFLERSRARIAGAAARLDAARNQLKSATQKVVEADRAARLLEKLKDARLTDWTAETDREIEAFAAESYLNRK